MKHKHLLLIFCLFCVCQVQAQLAYWYNDDYANRKVITYPASNDMTIVADLDVRDMPFGFNRITFQLADKTVYQGAHVLKVRAGKSNRIEYWFDDDYDNRHQIASNVYAHSFTITDEIDVSGLSDGAHRIHYRLVNNLPEHGAVYTHYFVKSKYTTAAATGATVTHAKYWTDDNKKQAVTVPVTNLNAADVFTTYMDAESLSYGNHNLSIQIVNSAGMWSSIETAQFEKIKYELGSMTLTATLEDELVYLRWNSMENIDYYRVFRNGTLIATERAAEHPANFLKVDNPKAGNYSYLVKAYHTNELKVYSSNEATITVNQTEENVDVHLSGTIQGTVRYGGGNGVEGVKLTLSHNNRLYYTSPDGSFLIQGIPYGTSGTLTAEKEDYEIKPDAGIFTDMDYEITELIPNRNYRLTATPVFGGVTPPPALQNPELQLTTAINGNIKPSFLFDQGAIKVNQPLSMGIGVKNISGKEWTGKVYLMIDPTEITGKYDYSFAGKILVAECEVKLKPEQEMELDFNIFNGIPKPSGEYWFSLVSQQLSGNQKLVAYGNYLNPLNVRIENQDVYKTAQDYMQMINSKFGTKSFIDALTVAGGYETDIAKKNKLMRTIIGDVSRRIQEALDMKQFLQAEKDVQELLGWIAEFDKYRNANFNDPSIFFQICGTILGKYGGPYGKIFEVYFDVGEKVASAIGNLSNFLFDQTIGEYEGGEIDIIVKNNKGLFSFMPFLQDKHTANDIASQIDKIELHYKMGTESVIVRELHKSAQQNRDALTYNIGYSSGGLMTSGKLKIIWSNGRVSWVPLTSQATNHYRPLGRIEVTFYSQNNGIVEYIADKLILILP